MQRAVKQRKSGCATAPFLRLSRAAARRRNAKEVFVDNRNNLAMLAVLYGSAFVAAFNENTINVALISIMGEFAVDANTDRKSVV